MNDSIGEGLCKIISQSDSRARRLYESDAASRLGQYSLPVDYVTFVTRGFACPSQELEHLVFLSTSDLELFAVVIGMATPSSRPFIYEETSYRRPEKKAAGELSRDIEQSGRWMLINSPSHREEEPVFHRIRPLLESIPETGSLRDRSILMTSLSATVFSATPSFAPDLGGLFVAITREGITVDDEWGAEVHGIISARAQQYLEQLQTAAKEDPVVQAIKRRSYQDKIVAEASIQRRLHENDQRQAQIADAVGTMGSAVFLLLHRFVNLQRPSESLARHFATPEAVAENSDLFMENMQQLRSVLEKTRRFERIITRAKTSGLFSSSPEFQTRELESVLRIIRDYAQAQQLVVRDQVDKKMMPLRLRWHPFYGEAIQVVLDNCQEAMSRSRDQDVRIRALNEGDRVAISIANNGPTIPPGTLRDIKCHRPVSSTTGTGLGLYFTWTLLRYIDGDIEVDNLPADRGVKTTLFVPVDTSSP